MFYLEDWERSSQAHMVQCWTGPVLDLFSDMAKMVDEFVCVCVWVCIDLQVVVSL